MDVIVRPGNPSAVVQRRAGKWRLLHQLDIGCGKSGGCHEGLVNRGKEGAVVGRTLFDLARCVENQDCCDWVEGLGWELDVEAFAVGG